MLTMNRSIMKILLFLFLIFAVQTGAVLAQETKPRKRPILNGAASYLPAPILSKEVKEFCASGKVEVEVDIDESGKVISARPISGDKLLFDSTISAARRATFRHMVDGHSVRMNGLLIYDFTAGKKCINAGIVNKRAINIPKPIVDKKLDWIAKEIDVVVAILVSMDGRVLYAQTVTDVEPMIRAAVEKSALGSRFSYVNDVPRNINVRASLVYKFKPDGTIEF